LNFILLGIIVIGGLYAVGKGYINLPQSVASLIAPLTKTITSTGVAPGSQSNIAAAEQSLTDQLYISGSGSGTEVGLGPVSGSAATPGATEKEVGAGLMAVAPATGPAAPFVEAAGGLLEVFSNIFSGANPLQVDAAMVEQCYECCSWNLMYLFMNAKMLTRSECVAGMQMLIQAGQRSESQIQAQVGNPAVKGSANLTKVINEDAATVQAQPEISTPLTWNQNQGENYYVGGSKGSTAHGWYPDAVSVAKTLTSNFMNVLRG
jgi:hypothetical protein